MLDCLAVGLGGFVGAVLRYLISLIPIKNPVSFPVNTFIINIVGAFAIGCIAFAIAKNENVDSRLLLFLKVGICGGFTTFSTFALETAELIKGGSVAVALIYVAASVGKVNQIRTRFKMADLPYLCVKNTRNTQVFLRFLP